MPVPSQQKFRSGRFRPCLHFLASILKFSFSAWLIFASLSSFAQENQVRRDVLQIRGQVFYKDGRPAGLGIQVQLMPGSGGVSQDVQTDSTGKFFFPSVSPVLYTVRVHMPGFLDDSKVIDMSITPSALVNLTLFPDPREANRPPAGLVAVLPADMPGSAQDEFNDAYNMVAAGKDFDRAIPHLKKAISAYPKYAPAYLLLGTAYLRTDKVDDAISTLEKAVEIDPKSVDAYMLLGEIFHSRKKYPEAEQNLVKAVALTPTSFDAQYLLGRACFYQHKIAEAQLHFEAALQANPHSAEAHIMLGNVMLRLRNAEGALKEYQEGVQLDPKGPMAESAHQMVLRIQAALAGQ